MFSYTNIGLLKSMHNLEHSNCQILNAPFSASAVCKLVNKFMIRSWKWYGQVKSRDKKRKIPFSCWSCIMRGKNCIPYEKWIPKTILLAELMFVGRDSEGEASAHRQVHYCWQSPSVVGFGAEYQDHQSMKLNLFQRTWKKKWYGINS